MKYYLGFKINNQGLINKKMSNQPLWLKKVNELLKKSYSLDLSGENITDIKLFPRTTALKHLNLSYTQLKSLQGMKTQKAIQSLNIEGSSISSFAGFSALKNLSNITLKRSLVEKFENYQISLLIVCPNVHTIDGRIVKSSTRMIAQKLAENPLVPKLVNLGWMATYPIEDEEIEDLAKEFGIQDSHLAATHYHGAQQGDLFEDELRRIDEEHNRIVEEAKISCGFAAPDMDEQEFQEEEVEPEPQTRAIESDELQQNDSPNYSLLERVATILAYAGQQIDNKNLQESVLRCIEALCEKNYDTLNNLAEQYNGEEEMINEEDGDFDIAEKLNEIDEEEEINLDEVDQEDIAKILAGEDTEEEEEHNNVENTENAEVSKDEIVAPEEEEHKEAEEEHKQEEEEQKEAVEEQKEENTQIAAEEEEQKEEKANAEEEEVGVPEVKNEKEEKDEEGLPDLEFDL